jgi:hypothetical protein
MTDEKAKCRVCEVNYPTPSSVSLWGNPQARS